MSVTLKYKMFPSAMLAFFFPLYLLFFLRFKKLQVDKRYLIWKGNSEDKHPFVVRKNCSGLLKSQQKYPGELSKPFLIGGGYRTSQKWIYE